MDRMRWQGGSSITTFLGCMRGQMNYPLLPLGLVVQTLKAASSAFNAG